MKKTSLLSLDIPWGGSGYVGAAFQEMSEGALCGESLLTSIAASIPIAEEVSAFPEADSEIAWFIENGAGPNRVGQADIDGPFGPFPVTPGARKNYLLRLWNAFIQVRDILDIEEVSVDLVLVDVPIVPAALALGVRNPTLRAGFRPLEQAFNGKVFIPGRSKRKDGRIQFPRLQSGVINGCRPGYAILRLACLAFNATTAVESFPQLVLGALSEFSNYYELPLITNLASHKNGSVANISAGQLIVTTQCTKFLGGCVPNWSPIDLPSKPKGDGFDALLGLLPGLVYKGYVPPGAGDSPWQRAVILRNLTTQLPPFPTSAGVGQPAENCRPWIDSRPNIAIGSNDSGILTLDLSLWG